MDAFIERHCFPEFVTATRVFREVFRTSVKALKKVSSLEVVASSSLMLCMDADHFINGCAYGSIGFIILDMSCEFINFLCIYVTCVTKGQMVE